MVKPVQYRPHLKDQVYLFSIPETTKKSNDKKIVSPPGLELNGKQNATRTVTLPDGRTVEADGKNELVSASRSGGGGKAVSPVNAETAPGGSNGETGKTVVNTDLGGHTPQEQQTILEYQNAVDPGLASFIETVKEHPEKRYLNYQIKTADSREIFDITSITGIDVTGYVHNIKPSAVEHILKRHGENGKADHSMANIEDIARIPYVIENYDKITLGDKSDYSFRNSDSSPSKRIVYEKAIDGAFYVVEAVPDSKAQKLQIVTAYINKKGAGQGLNAVKPPSADV